MLPHLLALLWCTSAPLLWELLFDRTQSDLLSYLIEFAGASVPVDAPKSAGPL
jgi:hypothetical protein